MGTVEPVSVRERVVELRSSISKKAIAAGGIFGILVNINVLWIPPFSVIGGGLIGGFVGGYTVGGLKRGAFHGTLAGAVAGFGAGILAVLLGFILAQYTPPPNLLYKLTGVLLPPLVMNTGPAEPILVLLGITFIVAIDGFVGGIAGGLARSAVDRVAGRD